MKKTYLLLLALFVSIVAMGGPVTPDEARQKIAKFMNLHRAGAVTQNPEALRLVATSHYKAGDNVMAPSYYVFNKGQAQGYVIAGADDRVPVVLGYSDHGSFDPNNMPANMKAWLQGYDRQMEYLNRHPEAAAPQHTVTGDAIDPLLDTRYAEGPIAWDQTAPYNNLCPTDNDMHCLTGCVATAMAQIMYYWKYPAASIDVIPGYTTEKLKIVMPDIAAKTAIDWDNIVPQYKGNETDAQKQAIANLMLMCGTAVTMDYTLDFSGAFGGNVASSLIAYFGYDLATDYEFRSFYHAEEWNQKVYDELKAGRPVYYDGSSIGSGHAFVIDGYGGDDYFHVNWGWGGDSNDYFLLSILNPNNTTGSGASNSSDGYSFDQGAIFGAQPDTGMSPAAEPILTTNAVTLPDGNVFTRTSTDKDFAFTVGFSYINHMSIAYQMDCGIALLDQNGQWVDAIAGYRPEVWNPGIGYWNPITFDIKLGKDIANGTFFLVPVSHEVNSDKWFFTKGTDAYNVMGVIDGNTLTLTGAVFGLTGTVKAEGKTEVGSPVSLIATIGNKGTTYLGELFLTVNGKPKCGIHGDIDAGKTKDFVLSFTPDSIGKQEVAICTRSWNDDGQVYDYTPFIKDSITIEAAPAADLAVNYMVSNADNNGIVKENVLKVNISITNNGTTAYDNQILFNLYKDRHTGDGYYNLFKTEKLTAKIEAGETKDISIDFTNLEDDKYFFSISYLSEGDWKTVKSYSYIIQTREPDPAPELRTTARTSNAVYENRSYILKTDTAVVSVKVENIGNLDYSDNIIVKLFKLTSATSGPQVAAGRQPIKLAAGADTIIVIKFPELEDGATYFYWTYYVANGIEVAGSQTTPIFTVKLPEIDGIELVRTNTNKVNGDTYNMNGQRVADSYKGIVIRNGRKTLRR